MADLVRCDWCGKVIPAERAASVPLNFGRRATVCPKCYRYDDGDRA